MMVAKYRKFKMLLIKESPPRWLASTVPEDMYYVLGAIGKSTMSYPALNPMGHNATLSGEISTLVH